MVLGLYRRKPKEMKRDDFYKSHVYDLMDRMVKKAGLKLDREDYPNIVFNNQEAPHYNYNLNEIHIPYSHVNSGDVLGEEIGNFMRIRAKEAVMSRPQGIIEYILNFFGVKTRPDYSGKEEKHSNEFYGYLGRKMLKDLAKPEDNLYFNPDQRTKGEAVQVLRKIRKRARELTESNDPNSELEKQRLSAYRKNILEHQRPYDYAENVDLDRIINYEKLFTLPDEALRHSFFREEPYYRSTKRSRLESLIRLYLVPASVLILLVFLTVKNITGYAVQQNFNETFSLSLMIILVALLLILAIARKYRKK